MLETVVTAIWDELSHITKKFRNSRLLITIGCSIVMFLLGLSMTARVCMLENEMAKGKRFRLSGISRSFLSSIAHQVAIDEV